MTTKIKILERLVPKSKPFQLNLQICNTSQFEVAVYGSDTGI